MSVIKSLSVGNGDMFYIKHFTDNFSIIDCCIPDGDEQILAELRDQSSGRTISRFISTHPDEDHIRGLRRLNQFIPILNFYCVENSATKSDETVDFREYCSLRDDQKKAFSLLRDCSRRWMNRPDETRGDAGINILWPILESSCFQEALQEANEGGSPNNISPIIKYSLDGGVTMIWMGDLERDFMSSVETEVAMPRAHILFAPHHGRDSGRVPSKWLEEMAPSVVVIGEAPSKHLNYYGDLSTLTQNSTGDITFVCRDGAVDIYVAKYGYSVDFLHDQGLVDAHGGYYIGTLSV